mmetsp:Transcript_6328/g.22562  ORF Transcript_6328/g.22562 Transcript_6328/m.22562 type:complete len:311 (-) Transcript_6328:718-1650(-)
MKGWRRRVRAYGRSLGSLMKHLDTKSLADSESSAGIGGGSLDAVMWNRAAMWLLNSLNGGFPVAICRTVQPTLHMSDFLEYLCSMITSGDMKTGVPLKERLAAESALCRYLEAPKSASLQTPRLSTRMFCPLMSLWMIPLSWRYVSPSSTSLVYLRMTDSSSFPKRLTSSATEPPGMCSRKMESSLVMLFLSVPRYFTMLGWLRVPSRAISASSWRTSSASCLSFCRNITCLTTKISPESRFIPRYTFPKDPDPIRFPLCHLLMSPRIRMSLSVLSIFMMSANDISFSSCSTSGFSSSTSGASLVSNTIS